jgi:glyoxylase-like metal-dependent hydrolase (beta-lactamase superfamily II)
MVILRRALLALIVLVGITVWWLGSSVPVPGSSSFWLAQPDAIDQLRSAATGTGPREVRVGIVGRTDFPAWLNTAWGGFDREPRAFITLQLLYADGSHVMIDAPFGQLTMHAILGAGATFDPKQFARMQRALASAQSIFLTHLHRDHVGALVDAPDPPALLARTAVTTEQRAEFRRKGEITTSDPSTLAFDVPSFDQLRVLPAFDRFAQVAPGVVAVKSPGHTPSHLLFYIRTTSGREMLYVGDLVWSFRNLETGRSRPRAISQYYLREDAPAVADQLRALITFAELNPEVEILVSHDADRLGRQSDLGVIEEGLQ